MQVNLRGKYLLLLILLVLLSVSISTWLHVQSTFTARLEEMESRATALARLVGFNFVDQFLKEKTTTTDNDSLKYWIQEVRDAKFIEVYSTDGTRLLEFSDNDFRIPDLRDITPTFTQEIMSGEKEFLARRIKESHVVDFLVPVTLFDTEIGLVRIGIDASRYYKQRTNIIMTNIRYGFVLLFVITLIGYLSSPYLIKPLRELASVAERFGQGEFDARSSVNSGDEIEQLSDRFNEMAQQTERLVENLSSAGDYHELFPYVVSPKNLYTRIVLNIRKSVDVSHVGLVLNQWDGPNPQQMIRIVKDHQGIKAYEGSGVDRETLQNIAEVSSETDTSPLVRRSQEAEQLTQVFPGTDKETLTDGLVFELGSDQGLGYLVFARDDREFHESELPLLGGIQNHIETSLTNASNIQDVLVDERTGIFPRGVISHMLNESEKLPHPDSLFLVNISADYSSNENNNEDVHPRIAQSLNKHLRELSPLKDLDHFSVISHDQSERFLAIMSGWSQAEIVEIFQEITDDLSNKNEQPGDLDLSVGIISIRDADHVQSHFDRCEQALTKARNQGGSSVCYDD